MPSSQPWVVIDVLVHDIGALSAQVQMAERTLATDPRTRAARTSLDRATDAVCVAIDDVSEPAAARAKTAIAETRALIAQLGLTGDATGRFVRAAGNLVAKSEQERHRAESLRRRLRNGSKKR